MVALVGQGEAESYCESCVPTVSRVFEVEGRGEGGRTYQRQQYRIRSRLRLTCFSAGGFFSAPRWGLLKIQRCGWGGEDPPNAKTACQDPTTGSFLLPKGREKKKNTPPGASESSRHHHAALVAAQTPPLLLLDENDGARRRREDFKMRIHQCHFWYVLRSPSHCASPCPPARAPATLFHLRPGRTTTIF